MTLLKACGLRSRADVEACAEAEYHGFILRSDSPRCLDLEQAARLLGMSEARRVLVTTESDLREIAYLVEVLRPDVLQVHSLMSAEDLRRLQGQIPEVWALLAVGDGNEKERLHELEGVCDGILLDTAGRRGGGTGRVHDWILSREIREASAGKVILAGGLHQGNVAEAIQAVHPDVIDVSSGIERGGRKDRQLFEQLRLAMRSA